MQTAITADQLSVRSYTFSHARHSHPYHQIILSLRGTLELATRASTDAVDDRKFAVVTAGREHSFRGKGDNRFLILDVPDQCLPSTAGLWNAASDQPFFTVNDHLDRLLAFARASRDDCFRAENFRSSLGSLILHELTEQISGQGRYEPETLRKAKAFIGAHFADAVCVQDIADAANVSGATLNRLFRTWHGKSPGKHLSDVRLAQAKTMLALNSISISRIAVSCGYSEQSALTRALRREHGMTPGAYRRRARQTN